MHYAMKHSIIHDLNMPRRRSSSICAVRRSDISS